MTVAALYVDDARTPYATIAGVEAWGEARDATSYEGPWPVVAHPPCGPWSRLAHLCGPALRAQSSLALLAVEQVRRWGGVLEHPSHSKLWAACQLPPPGGIPDSHGGFTVAVEQWWWGHRAVKPTWLYVVGASLPPVPPAVGVRPPSGGAAARRRDPALRSMLERLPKTQRHLTPPSFAAWLVSAAESVRR